MCGQSACETVSISESLGPLSASPVHSASPHLTLPWPFLQSSVLEAVERAPRFFAV